jgi:hypothetical protein
LRFGFLSTLNSASTNSSPALKPHSTTSSLLLLSTHQSTLSYKLSDRDRIYTATTALAIYCGIGIANTTSKEFCLKLEVNMDPNQNDELYPIAVLIDELKACILELDLLA